MRDNPNIITEQLSVIREISITAVANNIRYLLRSIVSYFIFFSNRVEAISVVLFLYFSSIFV